MRGTAGVGPRTARRWHVHVCTMEFLTACSSNGRAVAHGVCVDRTHAPHAGSVRSDKSTEANTILQVFVVYGCGVSPRLSPSSATMGRAHRTNRPSQPRTSSKPGPIQSEYSSTTCAAICVSNERRRAHFEQSSKLTSLRTKTEADLLHPRPTRGHATATAALRYKVVYPTDAHPKSSGTTLWSPSRRHSRACPSHAPCP